MNLNKFASFTKKVKKVEVFNPVLWLYTRVSSKDQELNRSLESQKDAAHKYAHENGYTLGMTFGSTYESASGDFTRKEFMKLINEVRSARKKPFAILINTISRFSRSGGGGITLAHELVEKLGVHIIEVSSAKNTMTEEGKLEIYTGLIQSRRDNLDRLKITIPGMVKMLENGHALGRTPVGYVHYGPRVKDHRFYSPTQRIEKSPDAPLVRKAWEYKLKGVSDNLIVINLDKIGLKVTKQQLSKMWRNPFYCGVNVNSLLGDKIVKGNWEPIVSDKEFFSVQNLLRSNRYGYKNELSNSDRPLMGFILCDECGGKMTGYEVNKKNLHYYKCQKCKDKTINAETTKSSKGIGAHQIFTDFLKCYELPSIYLTPFLNQLKLTYECLENEKQSEQPMLEKEHERLVNDLKKLQRKYAFDDLDLELYQEFKTEIEIKINDISEKLDKSR
ncbi:MAG: resolvase domain protein [Bacteroidota bacterium]|nr:resolvase domain protein [Bacteroidota bacterium]